MNNMESENQTVGTFVQRAIDMRERGLFEKAFLAAAEALRLTIRKVTGKDELTLVDYKSFIDEHWELIEFMSFPNAKSPYLDVRYVIKEISANPRRTYTLKEVTVFLTTWMLRQKRMPDGMKFHAPDGFVAEDDKLFVPASMIGGMVCMVIVTPENKGESLPDEYWTHISDFKMFVSEYWGRIDLAKRILEYYRVR
jgi:hypothetical protein